MLIEENTTDATLAIINGNGNGKAGTAERKSNDLVFAGDYHVIGLLAADCKLLNGFHYYDETQGWPLNPNAKRKKYLTLTELFAIKENLVAALDQELSLPVQRQIEQALQIVLAALGETESE